MSHAGDALFAPWQRIRRRPGRKTTSYAAYIQKLLGDTDSDLKSEAIASLAQDHSEWRNDDDDDDT